jgi:hypothetical protein
MSLRPSWENVSETLSQKQVDMVVHSCNPATPEVEVGGLLPEAGWGSLSEKKIKAKRLECGSRNQALA